MPNVEYEGHELCCHWSFPGFAASDVPSNCSLYPFSGINPALYDVDHDVTRRDEGRLATHCHFETRSGAPLTHHVSSMRIRA